MKDIGYGKAYGKVILMGEHSVVYNKPAIALPLKSLCVETWIKPTLEDVMIESRLYNGRLEDAHNLEGVRNLIYKLHEVIKTPLLNLNIKIESSLPSHSGLGSSAAVSVSIIRAFFDYYNIELKTNTLIDLAHYAETYHHLNPSGLDSQTVLSEDMIYFIKDKPVEKIKSNLKGYLVIADTGILGDTKHAVSNVKSFMLENELEGKRLINYLETLTTQAKKALENNQIDDLGMLMNDAQEVLRALGVSDEALEELIKLSLNHHALGAKLTGGGKGGSMIALMKNKEDAENLKEVLLNQAKGVWVYPLGV